MPARKKRSRASSADKSTSSSRQRKNPTSTYQQPTMSDEELASASRPVKNLKDKWLLIPEYLRVKGLVRQHIESYNHFLTHQIAKIIETNNEVKSTVDPQF